jgi:putative addiction module component (TIGR02574 family)
MCSNQLSYIAFTFNRLGTPAEGSAIFACHAILSFAFINSQEYDLFMIANLKRLPVDEKIQLVEDLWDSIASDQEALPLTLKQQAELDIRLESFENDGNRGRTLDVAMKDIRSRL